MSNELKTIKGRIQNKHGTEADWLKSVYIDGNISEGFVDNPFVPLDGELIIYDPDSINTKKRFKFGDGVTKVTELPFAADDVLGKDGILKQEVLPEGYPYAVTGNIVSVVTPIDSGSLMGPIAGSFSLVSGASYTVTWNGVEYSCIAEDTVLEGVLPCVGLGDTGAPSGQEPTGEFPFSILYMGEAGEALLGVPGIAFALDGSEEATISIDGSIIHKIDKAFLPDTSNLKNLVDGSAPGSIRTTLANLESDDYTMGIYAAAFGYDTKASGECSFAEGAGAASGNYSHAEGSGIASGDYSHAENNSTASGMDSHAEGDSTTASGINSHAEGRFTTASGGDSHAEGVGTKASSGSQHTQGRFNIEDTVNKYAHIVGNGNATTRSNAHTLDWNGLGWFAGGLKVGGTGQDDVNAKRVLVEGDPVGVGESTEGKEFTVTINGVTETVTGGTGAERFNSVTNQAIGDYSHAEGYLTTASGTHSHAEGNMTTASGVDSHAEGSLAIASGVNSHAEGSCILAASANQHVQGIANIEDAEGKYAHIVGNGASMLSRSNAHTLDWDGVAWFAGDVKVGGTGQDDEDAKTLATTEYVDTKVGEIDFSIPLDEHSMDTAAHADIRRKIDAINDVIGTDDSVLGTWVFNDEPDLSTLSAASLVFTSNGTEYNAIRKVTAGNDAWGIYTLSYFQYETGSTAFTNNPDENYGIAHGWTGEAYKTITITEAPTDETFITWLKNNATKQSGTIFERIEELENKTVSPQTSITYSELVALRDNSELTPGMFYRITDYQCTTTQENTRAMTNQFDIIVQALDVNVLSENASATWHEDDTYFANANLAAWELKYCLDNDTTRFAWADETNGKGVVYWMKDENNNECPYDFKNITYLGSSITGYEKYGLDANTYYPTFTVASLISYFQWGTTYSVSRNSGLDQVIDGVTYYGYNCSSVPTAWSTDEFYVTDNEITSSSTMYKIIDGAVSTIGYGGNWVFSDRYDTSAFVSVSNNIIQECRYANAVAEGFALNKIIFVGTTIDNNIFNLYCSANTFGNNCISNTFGNYCSSNTLGDNCNLNTFGNNCTYNIFGNNYIANTFGNYCSSNTFGNNCNQNTFGNHCNFNAFSDNCHFNTFGNVCTSNIFGNECTYNTFGNDCYSNTFGDNCYSNTFGDNCSSNTFGGSKTNTISYVNRIRFESHCRDIKLLNSETGNDSNYVQNITVSAGISGTEDSPLGLQVSRNAPPVVYEAAGTTHIILD